MMNLEAKIVVYEKAGRKAVSNAHFYFVAGDNDRFHAYLRAYDRILDRLSELYRLRREHDKEETKLYPLVK